MPTWKTYRFSIRTTAIAAGAAQERVYELWQRPALDIDILIPHPAVLTANGCRRNRTLIQQRPLPTKLSRSDIIFGQSKRKQNVLKPAGFIRAGQSTRRKHGRVMQRVALGDPPASRGFNARCRRLGHAIDGSHHDAGSSLVSLAITSIPHNVSCVLGIRRCRPIPHQVLQQSSREVLVVFVPIPARAPRWCGAGLHIYTDAALLEYTRNEHMLPSARRFFFSFLFFNKE